jgi:hypothetical protein
MLCRFTNEELITLPWAPPSMRIRAVWPLTLQTNVRRVDLACSTEKVDTPTPFFRNRRILLLDIEGTDANAGERVVGPVAEIEADSVMGSDKGVGMTDVGAREEGDIGGSRSTVSVNPAPS